MVAEGVPHHITQRGNNRQDVFLLDEDRRFYIETLRAKSEQHGLTILGYCLMSNHVHLVALPTHAMSLARAGGQAHWRYSMRFNKQYGRKGHLWRNRFYSCPLGPTHLVTALACVDLNPVRAGMVGEGPEYPWSSASAHCGEALSDRLLEAAEWGRTGLSSDWEQRLRAESTGGRVAEIRSATHSGLPLGDERFMKRMEVQQGRRLRPTPPGPAPKARKCAAGAS